MKIPWSSRASGEPFLEDHQDFEEEVTKIPPDSREEEGGADPPARFPYPYFVEENLDEFG